MTKLTVCTAVILSLVFTASSFAGPTTTFTLDAESLAAGSYSSATSPLTFSSPGGTITFVGEIRGLTSDAEFNALASGNTFDILGSDDTPARTAVLSFGFDVLSIEFVYGGNAGDILIEARDEHGGVVDSFYQASTFINQPAGPVTLSGSGIRSLYWTDNWVGMDYAPLDEITLTVIPSPSAVILAGIGISFVFGLRRRKIV